LAIISGMTEQIPMIKLALKSTHQTISNDISYIIWRLVFIEIQVYQYSNIIGYLLKLAWHLLWQMTASSGMNFNYVMEIACIQTITILYKYFYVWELDLRLNNINYHQSLSLIIIDIYIDFNHHCHYCWTSESLLNLWEYTQDLDITNK